MFSNMYLRSIEHQHLTYQGESGETYDIDWHNLEFKTPLSTQEVSVAVNQANKTMFGDVVRYGDWGDLDKEEVLDVLSVVEREGYLKRPYENFKFITV